MSKKLKNFLYPDWRKLSIFLIVILFFALLWMRVLINSLPIMIIGTHEFEHTFCDIKLTAANCSLNQPEIYQKEVVLNQTVNQLNVKYNQFSNLNSVSALAKMLMPSGALSCMLDRDVLALKINVQKQDVSFLGMTTCDSSGMLQFIMNLVIVYLVICCLFWFYDKRK